MKNKNEKSIKPRFWIALLVFGLVLFSLSACLAKPETPSIESLFSPTPTLTLTPTIQWFPVTSTPVYEARTTATPNPAASPNYGALIFSDQTDSTKNWTGWQDSIGSVVVSDGSITLSVNSARGSVTAFRNNTSLENFYFESVMSVGLCKNGDQVGILFRTTGSQSFYRLLFKCEGSVALQKVIGGEPSNLIDWSLSNQLGPGLNTPVKVSVWEYGKTIRIYLNDRLFFETTDSTFYNGGIGFYARAAGETNVTVNFTSISVYEVSN
jgi:hypothetical protein